MHKRHFLNFSFFVLFSLASSISYSQSILSVARKCQSIPYNQTVLKSIQQLGVVLSTKLKSDYGTINQSETCYLEAWPKNTNEVAKLVKFAYTNGIPIRTQGNNHSVNGFSLPKKFELLIHTTFLNEIIFKKENIITVGAGIPIVLVKKKIEEVSDYSIPIYNGGGIGPTVGGFITAGGVGMRGYTEIYGGFWEQVTEITLVTGYGHILHIKDDSPLFLWLFGSMGQLGIITQANLKTIPTPSQISHFFPLGRHLTVPLEIQHTALPLYWFNLFVKENQLNTATHDLQELKNNHPNALNSPSIYHWRIHYIKKNPPLIFPFNESLDFIGFYGENNSHDSNHKELFDLAQDFSRLVLSKHYFRYIQTEYLTGDIQQYYQKYFGEKIYGQFKAIKKKLDPKFYFDQNSVFRL